MIKLFGIWTLYVLLGIIWLNYFSNKRKIQSENVIGSLMIVTLWPLHIIYELIRKK